MKEEILITMKTTVDTLYNGHKTFSLFKQISSFSKSSNK